MRSNYDMQALHITDAFMSYLHQETNKMFSQDQCSPHASLIWSLSMQKTQVKMRYPAPIYKAASIGFTESKINLLVNSPDCPGYPNIIFRHYFVPEWISFVDIGNITLTNPDP